MLRQTSPRHRAHHTLRLIQAQSSAWGAATALRESVPATSESRPFPKMKTRETLRESVPRT